MCQESCKLELIEYNNADSFKRMLSTVFTRNENFNIYVIETILYNPVQCTVISVFFAKMLSNK